MSTTARELRRRQWLLVALCVLATLALFGSYTGVHAGAVPLATSTSAGVLDVDTAKAALLQAQRRVVNDVAADRAGTGDFYQQISTADQSLAAAAAEDVTGADGRETLRTLFGLITTYTGWVAEADKVRADSLEHAGYVYYATEMLGGKDARTSDTSVMGRLNALRAQQVRTADRQASFGWMLWTGWTLAALLCVLLVAALAEAHRFTRARFRTRWNRQLAAAGLLLVAGAAVLVVFTWQTHTGLFHVRTLLHGDHAGPGIGDTAAEIARRTRGTGLRATAGYGILGGGAVLVSLVMWGLQPRINEYRPRVPR